MQPSPAEVGDVTRLLQRWSRGERNALDELMPLVYDRLRHLAHDRLRGEHGEHRSLDTTGLVHEAYLKLVDLRQARFADRAHFLAMASRVMRRLLVDHARARRAAKRGGGDSPLLLEGLEISDERADALTELDDALERLAAVDPRRSQILEQRYFGGLSLEETAEALGVSLATAKRDLRFARAWLAAELGGAVHL